MPGSVVRSRASVFQGVAVGCRWQPVPAFRRNGRAHLYVTSVTPCAGAVPLAPPNSPCADMAIYSLRMQVISRGKGRSATAAAAYRSGEQIPDERTGVTYDYTGKSAIYGSEILLPENAPERFSDRATLWNEVEQTEKRKDAQLSREVMIALPVELNHEAKEDLMREYVRREFVAHGMIADVCYHDFDSNNPHAHIMLTMRSVDADGFGKKQRQWNHKSEIEQHRKGWADAANAALEQAGYEERIDHRSLAAQGIERVPQIHLGAQVMEMESRGIHTRVGDESRRISQINRDLARQAAKYQQIQRQIEAEKIAVLASPEPEQSGPAAALSSEQALEHHRRDVEREQRERQVSRPQWEL